MSERGLAPATATILAIAFALAGPILALAPLGMAPLVIAAGILATAAERIQGGAWPRPPLPLAVALGALLLWSALTLIWGIDPREGARKLLDIAVIWAALVALLGLADRVGPEQRRRLALAMAGGLAVGLILLAIETMLDYPLHRLVMGNDNPRLVDLVESKRSVDALPLLVWPVAIALARLGRTRLAIVLILVFAVACTRWTASSAMLGMAVAIVILLLAARWPGFSRRLLAAFTVLAFVLVVPFAIVTYDHGAARSPLIKRSGQHRAEIWHFAAERARERPLFGHGLDSSRAIPNGSVVSAFQAPDKPIIPLHPHNAFLQIWLELGAVGVVLAAIPPLLALRAIGGWPLDAARLGTAGFAASLIVAGLAFGIWQSWWMATLAFSAVAGSTVARGAYA
jgi:hypothetical protein